MTYTENYQLNQWAKTDRIQMSDFNADNAKIDAALKANANAIAAKADTSALSALQTQIANCGNCRIVSGSYVGSGTYGSSNPNTLTFDKKPFALFIGGGSDNSSNYYNLFATRASKYASVFFGVGTDSTYGCETQWSETGVSWYHGMRDYLQMNTSGKTYQYIALVEC